MTKDKTLANTMKSAALMVRCLEAEGVKFIFGIPGEENIGVMDALLESNIQFVATRHEQGAAFMADVYGRLTGKAGVCMSTLGPGATNLVTGFADANMDRAPIVAIAGQGATTRMHKESHQVLDLVNLFDPISKYSIQIREPEIVPEIIRKAFKFAEAEKPGGSFIEFPENIAEMSVTNMHPLKVQSAAAPTAPIGKAREIAALIDSAKHPIIIAGNGVVRHHAARELVSLAETLNVPVATTFMAKGVIPSSHNLSLGTIGLKAKDLISYGVECADLVICVGYDLVEYPPAIWNPACDKKIVHIDGSPAEVDAHYILEAGITGDLKDALTRIEARCVGSKKFTMRPLRDTINTMLNAHQDDMSFPVKPQKIIVDLRKVMAAEDILISDVGAHKMWIARMFQAETPNSCIISNGFASMGIALPGAIAAKLVYPERNIIAVSGDAGFMMNNQEIETALRLGLNITILIFNDNKYGLIEWHQLRHYGRKSNIDFQNPDFVAFAESFGAKGYRINRTEDLIPTLQTAMSDGTVSLIDVPVDYAENMKLTKQLASMSKPEVLVS